MLCVNVLRDDQAYISDTFAGRNADVLADRFDCAEWTTQVTGSPRVVDPLVAFDCRLTSHDRVGTHYVFFAERGSPLIYANRAYGTSAPIDPAVSTRAVSASDIRTLAIGCFHTFGPYIVPGLVRSLAEADASVRLKLIEGDQRRVRESLLSGETEVALMYALDGSEELHWQVLTELHPYVLLAEGHVLAAQPRLTPQDLAAHSMVLLSARPSREYFLNIMRSAGVEPTVACESSSFEMVRGLVGHGLGYALLATKPASTMTYDGRALVTRPLVGDAPASKVVLATCIGAKLSEPATQFVALCRAFFETGQLAKLDEGAPAAQHPPVQPERGEL